MRPRILIVEDDAVTRTLAGRILEDRYAIMAEGRDSHFDTHVLDAFMSEIPVAAVA